MSDELRPRRKKQRPPQGESEAPERKKRRPPQDEAGMPRQKKRRPKRKGGSGKKRRPTERKRVEPAFFETQGFWLLVGGAAVVIALFFYGKWNADHQPLYVVNGLDKAITVSIDGKEVIVPPDGFIKTTASGGKHDISVISPKGFAEDYTIDMKSNLFSKPAFVIDPTRSACVIYEDVVFAADVKAARNTSAKFKVHLGQQFITYRRISYLFEKVPAEIKINSNKDVKKKTSLSFGYVSPIDAFLEKELEISFEDAVVYAETHLRNSPDEEIQSVYVAQCAAHNQKERATKFLQQLKLEKK